MDFKFPVDRDFLFHNIPTSAAVHMDKVKNTPWTIPTLKLLFPSTLLVSSFPETSLTVSTLLCGWMTGSISKYGQEFFICLSD